MYIPKNIWDDIVKNNGSGEANVEWVLRAEIPVSSVQTIVIAPPVKSEVTEVIEVNSEPIKVEAPSEKRKYNRRK